MAASKTEGARRKLAEATKALEDANAAEASARAELAANEQRVKEAAKAAAKADDELAKAKKRGQVWGGVCARTRACVWVFGSLC